MAPSIPLHRIPIWTRSIRAGVSPVSLVRRSLGDPGQLRYRGVAIQSADPVTTWDVVDDLLGRGTYDVPGFVPRPGWRVVDIGGNVGLFAITAAARGAHVRAYEPHPETARFLRRNAGRWDVDVVEKAVVGQPSGPLRLYVSDSRHIRNTLLGMDPDTGVALADAVEVATVPLAEVLAEPVDLLKVDCEGGEYDLFANGREALRNAARIIAEVHHRLGDPEQALADVRAAGFAAELDRRDTGYPYSMLTATRR